MNFPAISSSAYAWLMLAGVAMSAWWWWRLARRDDRLVFVYVGGLVAAFLGAKLAYVIAEGWRDLGQADLWARWAAGKSILGAFFGGYAGVELAKRWAGHRGATGDWFAMIAPTGVILGRFGCWLHGCCLGREMKRTWFTLVDDGGVNRWPAVPAEILFNAAMLVLFWVWRRRGFWLTQHFHVYLIAYGLFRFGHEFLRDTPRVWKGLSGYQFLALALAGFGLMAFSRRRRAKDGLGRFSGPG